MDLWVVGGEQQAFFAEQKETWRGFKRGVVVRVSNGEARAVFEYCSPAEHAPEEPSPHFTAATFTDDTAYLCTPTEVIVCSLPEFTIRRVISHPYFNDLHHVALSPSGTLYVVVTGLDAVAELTPEGETIRLIAVLGGDVWDTFSPEIDYRRVPTTKPHRAHPNHVCFIDGKPWVTLFEQRTIVPLGEGSIGPPLHRAGLHDGTVRGDTVLLTSVDGQVLRFSPRTQSSSAVDLVPVSPLPQTPLGWCRGLLPIDDDLAWLGFTRLRYTSLRRNLSWLRHRFRPTEHAPVRETRIALYSLRAPAFVKQIGVEGAGLNAVFSIHPVAARRSGLI